jgi:hypothetical protein
LGRQAGPSDGSASSVCLELPTVAPCADSIASFLALLPCRDEAGIAAWIAPARLIGAAHFLELDTELEGGVDANGVLRARLLQNLTVILPAWPELGASPDVASFLLGFEAFAYAPESAGEGEPAPPFFPCPVAHKTVVECGGANLLPCPVLEPSFVDTADVVLGSPLIRSTAFTSISVTRRVSELRLGIGSILYSINVPASPAESIITITETLPWMLRRVQGTLMAWVDSESGRIVSLNATISLFSPSIERGKPEVASLCISLPPLQLATSVCVSSRFEATLLHSQEYPPDAHRGFDVPSALVEACTPLLQCSRVRSVPLFVELPSPDFSMPFNVATLVSTAMAFVLGTMLNVLARRPRHEQRKGD